MVLPQQMSGQHKLWKLEKKIVERVGTSTRCDPLYHKKLRGQIVPRPRFDKLIDLRDYLLVQSERPAGWSVDRYPGHGDISSKPRVSYGRGARHE
jgi:hypothetical protein